MNFIDAATQREFADTATGDERGRVEVEPLTNYLATRVRRDVGQRAGFGVLTTLVNRNLNDPALEAQLPGSALVVGGDGHLFLTSKRDYVVAGSFSGSRVAGSDTSMLRLQRSSARYFQRPDATHLSYNPARHVALGLEPADRLQQEQRERPAQRVVLGGEPRLRGERRRLHDQRGPDGQARGAGVDEADARSAQPAAGNWSSRSGTPGTSPATRWGTATSRRST